ncbi:MAG: tetratricopeptide repeat protein [Desulfovibrionaceae bacterium]
MNRNNTMSRRKMLFGALKGYARNADVPEPKRDNPGQDAGTLAKANAAFDAGDHARAVEGYRRFLEAEPGNEDARLRLGRALYAQGQYVQARVEFERVLRTRKEDNQALAHLGLSLLRTGKTDKAVAVWKRYFDPTNVLVQREINLQLGLLETGDAPDPDAMALAVEMVLARAEHLAGTDGA